jgi:Na+-transporting methylmalonyl-CoA/oxaloacetate decarboxylase gamma subunit
VSVSTLSATPNTPLEHAAARAGFKPALTNAATVQRRSRSLISVALVFLTLLLIVTLLAQVYLTGATIESKHREEVARTETSELESQVFELKSKLDQRLTPLAVETFAKQQLQMDYAHAVPQAGIVYLNEEDRASFAQAAPPGDGGIP